MQLSLGVRPYRSAIASFVALTILATACNGGVRPTLTDDRLDENAANTADDGAQAGAVTEPTVAATDTNDTSTESTSENSAADNPTSEVTATGPDIATTVLATEAIEQLRIEVIETLPHDPWAFTQGLELHNGFLFESTGARGPDGVLLDSTLRRVDPTTGQIAQSITIEQPFFAEGLTKVDDQLIQLTWQSGVAFYRDATTFELQKEVRYNGDGWGLCYDDTRLIMTDGSNLMTFRDPITFDATGSVSVSRNGEAVVFLNELECVNGLVWANIFGADEIVGIDPATGNVTATIDATSLERPIGDGGAVLNGIAFDQGTGSYYLTGKLWPTMYLVNLVEETTG